MELVRLIVDLEPTKRDDVQMMFTARFDCKHDEEAIKHAQTKFVVHRFTGKRKATGWPNGPNQMMGESYEHVIESIRNRKMSQHIDAILFIEADCVPLCADWIDKLYSEFKASGKMITGAWLKRGDAGIEHVNGNCIISTSFWRQCPQIFHPPSRGGWDAILAPRMLPYSFPSKYIWSDYRLGKPDNPWRGCDFLWAPKRYGDPTNAYYGVDLYPAWLHGPKTLDGIKCVRERLLTPKPDAQHETTP